MVIRVGSIVAPGLIAAAAVGNVFTARGEGYALLLAGIVIVGGLCFLWLLARGAGRGQ